MTRCLGKNCRAMAVKPDTAKISHILPRQVNNIALCTRPSQLKAFEQQKTYPSSNPQNPPSSHKLGCVLAPMPCPNTGFTNRYKRGPIRGLVCERLLRRQRKK